MEIEAIRGQYYDDRGTFWLKDSHGQKRQLNRAKSLKKVVDAIFIDKLELTKNTDSTENEVLLLTQFVKSLPDDYVKERIYQVRDSFPIIDDFLVEKLIMEEL